MCLHIKKVGNHCPNEINTNNYFYLCLGQVELHLNGVFNYFCLTKTSELCFLPQMQKFIKRCKRKSRKQFLRFIHKNMQKSFEKPNFSYEATSIDCDILHSCIENDRRSTFLKKTNIYSICLTFGPIYFLNVITIHYPNCFYI